MQVTNAVNVQLATCNIKYRSMKKSFYLALLLCSLFLSFSFLANKTIDVELEIGGTSPTGKSVLHSALMNCGEPFFDPGGQNGDFQPGDSQVVTFCPDNPDDFIVVSFDEWDLGLCCDAVLEVHQGETLGNLLFTHDAAIKPFTVSGFEPGCLTFNFTANADALPAAGWVASVSCSPCPPPFLHFVENITNESVDIFVESFFFSEALIWEVGAPGFTSNNEEFIISGLDFGPFLPLSGLESGTAYDIYVANFCDFTDTSAYYGPIPIFTMPACGDDFFDPGGPDGDILLNSSITGQICSDVPGQVVSITFDEFDLGPCCNELEIFDSEFPNGIPIGTYTGTNNPGMISSTDFSGCLSFNLISPGGSVTGPGWEASVSCVTCPTPTIQSANQISSTSAEISWSFIMPASYYYYELGTPNFEPGTGDFISSGNVSGNTVLIPGLQGNTEYEVAVRSHCGSFDTSAFSQKLPFVTSPSCGDVFYDAGGPDGNYDGNQTVVNTICPNEPGTVIQLDFDTFSLTNNGSFFDIYDGDGPFSNLIGSWFGDDSPNVVSATNASDCLTVIFFPNGQPGYGWAANVNCITCPNPNNVTFSTADVGIEFFWNFVSDASSYHWEIGLPGFGPGTGNHVLQATTTQNNIFGINGLNGNTEYEFYVQSLCGGGDSSAFSGPLTFITPPSCGDKFYDPGGPDQDYEPFASETTTICPNEPNTFAQVVFHELDVPSCCANLFLNDGINFVNLSQNPGIPPPITSQNPNGCLNFQFDSFNDLSIGSGWDATINCVSCPEAYDFRISRVTGESVRFNWQSTFLTLSTKWEVGLKGFAPGTGTAAAGGSSPIAFPEALATGLVPNTEYGIYLKNVCAAENSLFAGPFSFRTAPSCNGQFYDPAGPDSNYIGNSISMLTVVCPDEPDRFVEVEFTAFNVGPFFNDILDVYDDNDISPNSLGQFSGTNLPPVFSATNASGCLAFAFNAFSGQSLPGWEANVICVDCPRGNGVTVSEIEPHLIEVTWEAIPVASQYFLEIGEKGFEPGTGEAVFTETVNANMTSFVFTGLESGTFYDIYMRTDCNGDFSPFTQRLRVSTHPTCGDFFFDPGGPNDQYAHNETYVTTICPEIPDDHVTISFNIFSLESCCDFLNVFNGTSLFGSFLGSFSGSIPPDPFTSTHSSGCLSFEFVSNESTAGNGWEAVVSCELTDSYERVEKDLFHLQVFPNPTSSLLNLVFDYPAHEVVSVEVHDIMGQRILKNPLNTILGKNMTELDLGEMPVGTYLVSVRGAHGIVTEKVVRI